MAKYRITYEDRIGREPEEIEAALLQDAGEWMDFYPAGSQGLGDPVLRVRADHVNRVERI